MDSTTDHKMMSEVVLGKSIAGSIGGMVAVILSILGLAHLHPDFMTSATMIAIGIVLLFKGGMVADEYSKLASTLSHTRLNNMKLSGNLSVEALCGLAGIILGVLSFLGLDCNILASVANIIFGAGMLIGTSILSRLNTLRISISGAEMVHQKIAEEVATAGIGAHVLVGIASMILGILSLLNVLPSTLNLIALLSIGAILLITSNNTIGKMLGITN